MKFSELHPPLGNRFTKGFFVGGFVVIFGLGSLYGFVDVLCQVLCPGATPVDYFPLSLASTRCSNFEGLVDWTQTEI